MYISLDNFSALGHRYEKVGYFVQCCKYPMCFIQRSPQASPLRACLVFERFK